MEHMLPITTTQDVRQTASKIAVLPVGSCEQHGAYLPLTTDTLIAVTIASEIASAYGLWLLPPLTIGCSQEHASWPGTVSIKAPTLYQVVSDVAESTAAAGAGQLVIVNGHGGNYVLANIAQTANTAGPRVSLFPSSSDWDHAREAGGLATSSHDDMHAGEIEVSLLLHAYPEVVRGGYADADHDAPDRPLLHLLGMSAYTTNGVIGRPSLATAEKGQAVLAALTRRFEPHLKALDGS